jgi:hypothetical protein
MLTITGKYITNTQSITQITIPSIYAIVADYIDTSQYSFAHTQNQQKMILQLCNNLDFALDPHITNYAFSYNETTKEEYITLLDTEYFPVMVGKVDSSYSNNYFRWYYYLITKYFYHALGTHKHKNA